MEAALLCTANVLFVLCVQCLQNRGGWLVGGQVTKLKPRHPERLQCATQNPRDVSLSYSLPSPPSYDDIIVYVTFALGHFGTSTGSQD